MRRSIGFLLVLAAVLFTLFGVESLRPHAARAAQPPATVTREQFTLALAGQLHLQPASGATQVFSDLPPGDPSFGLVMAAYKAGWISGYPDGTFRPGASLTREQVAKCEIIALDLQTAAASLSAKSPAYVDAGTIGRWAWGYVNEAAAIGILRGFGNGTFGPQSVFTQAQIGHAQAQLATYLAKTPLHGFAIPPTAAGGSAAGASAISVTPNAAADSIAVLISPSPITVPNWGAALPSGAASYNPGDNLAVTANAYVGIYETSAQHNLVAFSQIQVTSGEIAYPPAKLTLSGPQSGIAAGAATNGAFALTLVDENGNPAAAPAGGVTVVLTSDSVGGHEFSATPSGAPVTSITIAQGKSSAAFYYGDVLAGTHTLSAQSPGLSSARLSTVISAAGPAALALSGPQSAFSGATATIGPFTVTLADAYGNTAQAPAGGIPVNLSSYAPGTYEFAATPAGVPVTTVSVPAGSSSATFYYGDSQAGQPTLLASSASLGTARLTLQISTATVAALTLSGPQSGAAQGASPRTGPFTVTLNDTAGNPVPAPFAGVTVTLASNSQGAFAFAAALGGAPLASITIPAGSSSATFYYGDAQPGTPTISISAPGLPTATQTLVMAAPVNLVGAGLDSPSTSATPQQVQAWYAQGYRNIFLNTFATNFAQQYVNSLAQLDVILFQGYYTPAFTSETGAQRAQQAIRTAQAVGYPEGAYIFVDVESTGTATPQQLIGWINSWSTAVEAAGYGAGVYFGVPQPVSAAETSSLVATRFWKSLSTSSITPTVRGVCVVQTGYTTGSDTDIFVQDNLGGYCVGAGR